MCLNIHQAVFCSGVTPQLSHAEEASLLHQTCPFLHLWCRLLLGIGCPVGNECCWCRTESLSCTERRRSTCLESAKGTRWPQRFLPPVPHSWRFPLGAYVTVSEAGEGSLQVAVLIRWCLLSSLMLSGRICSSLFSAGEAGRALWHMHTELLRWDLRANGSQGCDGRRD